MNDCSGLGAASTLIYAMFTWRLILIKFVDGQNTPLFAKYLLRMPHQAQTS